jgi:hypothetical protein
MLVRDLQKEEGIEVRPAAAGRANLEVAMQFRWVALIALWTFLSGPIFAGPWAQSKPASQPAKTPVFKQQR